MINRDQFSQLRKIEDERFLELTSKESVRCLKPDQEEHAWRSSNVMDG
jgi:hypothetical protein